MYEIQTVLVDTDTGAILDRDTIAAFEDEDEAREEFEDLTAADDDEDNEDDEAA